MGKVVNSFYTVQVCGVKEFLGMKSKNILIFKLAPVNEC